MTITFKTETSLENFKAWSGGADTLNDLINAGEEYLEKAEQYIEECLCSDDRIPTDTEINDFLWFERDSIYENIGLDENGEIPAEETDWDSFQGVRNFLTDEDDTDLRQILKQVRNTASFSYTEIEDFAKDKDLKLERTDFKTEGQPDSVALEKKYNDKVLFCIELKRVDEHYMHRGYFSADVDDYGYTGETCFFLGEVLDGYADND